MASKISTGVSRAFNTCQECRRRKLKCDKARPRCQRCQSSGISCRYEGNHFRFVNDGPQARASVSGQSRAASDSVSITPERLDQIESRLEVLTAMVQSIQRPPPSQVSGDNESTLERPQAISPTSHASSGHLNIQGGGRVRYVEPSFWACITDEVAKIDDLMRNQNRYETRSSDTEDEEVDMSSVSDSLLSKGKSHPKQATGDILSKPPAWNASTRSSKFLRPFPNLESSLPSKMQCDVLLDAFIWNYHPIVPLVHIPSLQQENDAFWLRSATKTKLGHWNTTYTPLLLAVWYAGSVVCSSEQYQEAFPATTQLSVSTKLYKLACRGLRSINFPRTPTVESLTAYVLLQGTWMRDEEPLTCCAFVGTAVRVAQMLGLNREPSQFPKLSLLTAEIRRRVWWHIFHVDVLIALASGLPPLISQDSWNVRPISELRDEYIGSAAGQAYEEGLLMTNEPHSVGIGSMVSSIGVLAAAKHQDSVAMRSLVNKLYTDRHMTRHDVLELRQRLEDFDMNMSSRFARIPNETDEYTPENNTIFNRWGRTLLQGWCDKHWCLAYSPLLNRTINSAWGDLYPVILHKCRAWLRKVVYLSCTKEFQSYIWAWPGNHQPLHPIMVLIREADLNPVAVDAEASRHAVDEAMALCGPDGGLVGNSDEQTWSRPLTEGGKESWDLIKRLRSDAWSKAGIDPDVMTTRAEVQEVIQAEIEEDATPFISSTPFEHGHTVADEDMTASLAETKAPIPNIFWNEWDGSLGARGESLLGFDSESFDFG